MQRAINHLEMVGHPRSHVRDQFYQRFYIDALVQQAQQFDLDSYDHIIMSYHGLPDRHVDKVYEGADNLCKDHQCETVLDADNKYCYKATAYETSRLIADKLGIQESDYTVAFQSRLDKKWLTPFSDEVIEDFAKELKNLLVFSPAFVADCLETLIEIGSSIKRSSKSMVERKFNSFRAVTRYRFGSTD